MELILSILRFLWTLFLVIMVFNFMILVHEYGHFIAARWRGLVVDRFQIWFGKPIWKKEINGVQYGLGCIPAGGFVSLPQMVTMEGIEGKIDDEIKEALPPISPLDKIIVAGAGPLFSFILAVIFAFISWGVKRPSSESLMSTAIGYVQAGSAAEKGGIKVGDKLKTINGVEIDSFRGMGNSLTWLIVSAPPGPREFVVERNGADQKLTIDIPIAKKNEVTGGFFKKTLAAIFNRPPLPVIGVRPLISPVIYEPAVNSPTSQAGLKRGDKIVSIDGKPVNSPEEVDAWPWVEGKTEVIGIERGAKKDVPGKLMTVSITPRMPEKIEIQPDKLKAEFMAKPDLLGLGLSSSGLTWLKRESPTKIITDSAKSIYNTLTKVFSGNSGISGAHLSGPAGIGGILYDFLGMEDGWRLVIFFGALLNVNLAILNLMPFPVLDGGHIVMATTEWIRRKPTPVKLLFVLQNTFVYLLFGFMIFITFKDVGDRLPNGEKTVFEVEWSKSN